MRCSAYTTLVCLAVAVAASPMPFEQDQPLQARDAWTPPVRREVFAMRGGSFNARNAAELEARKVEIARSEAELQAKRDAAAELAGREDRAVQMRAVLDNIEARGEAFEAAKREYEELQLRELLQLGSRDSAGGSVHFAKREPQFGNFDINSLLSGFGNSSSSGNTGSSTGFGGLSGLFSGPFTALNSILSGLGINLRRDELEMVVRAYNDDLSHISKRQFGNFNINSLLGGFGNTNSTGNTASSTGFGGLGALFNAPFSALNSIFSSLGFNLRRDELEIVARALDNDLSYVSKRQFGGNFNFNSILGGFGNGTTGGNSGTGGFGGLGGIIDAPFSILNSIFSGLGFNLRRDQLEMVVRALDDDLSHVSKRQFGGNFNFGNILGGLGNGTTSGNTGSSGFGGLGGIIDAPFSILNSIFSGLGFNLRRDQLELIARVFDESAQVSKRDPQFGNFGNFNLNSLLSSFGNFNGSASGTTGSNTGFSGLGGLSTLTGGGLGNFGGGDLSNILGSLGFNFRREEAQLGARALPLGVGSAPVEAMKRDPFGLDAFVQSKRND